MIQIVIAITFATLAFCALSFVFEKYKQAVAIAHTISDQRTRGFIANDWGCSCGHEQCLDAGVSDQELRSRYDSVLLGSKQQLKKKLLFVGYYFSVFILSVLAISYLLTHQNQ